MNRPYRWRRGWPVVAAALLILWAPGCKDDDTGGPEPNPNPDLSMTLGCSMGLTQLTVENSGGAMAGPTPFVAAFADQSSDTLQVELGAGESQTCTLSNIRGGVTVTNEEWDLSVTADDCLVDFLQGQVAGVNLASYIPSPLTQIPILWCTYTVYLSNFHYAAPTVELVPNDAGLIVRVVYRNLTGSISAPAPEVACTDMNGSLSIASITVDTQINIGEGDDPEVTLGSSQSTISGFQVNLDGAFGAVVSWITSFFLDDFTNLLANAISENIGDMVGADLSAYVIANSRCAP